MMDMEKNYLSFWKRLSRRSASSPVLARAAHSSSSRASRIPQDAVSRHVLSSEDLSAAPPQRRLAARGEECRSAEDLLEASPLRSRRAASASQLTRPFSAAAAASKSTSALEVKATAEPAAKKGKEEKRRRLGLSLGKARHPGKKRGSRSESPAASPSPDVPDVPDGSVASRAPFDFLLPDDGALVTSPTYDVLTPSELYARRSTRGTRGPPPRPAHASTPNGEAPPPATDTPDARTQQPPTPSLSGSEESSTPGPQTPATAQQEQHKGRWEGRHGGQEESQEGAPQGQQAGGHYAVPGPPVFIYEQPPPPRPVASFPGADAITDAPDAKVTDVPQTVPPSSSAATSPAKAIDAPAAASTTYPGPATDPQNAGPAASTSTATATATAIPTTTATSTVIAKDTATATSTATPTATPTATAISTATTTATPAATAEGTAAATATVGDTDIATPTATTSATRTATAAATPTATRTATAPQNAGSFAATPPPQERGQDGSPASWSPDSGGGQGRSLEGARRPRPPRRPTRGPPPALSTRRSPAQPRRRLGEGAQNRRRPSGHPALASPPCRRQPPPRLPPARPRPPAPASPA